MGLESVPWVVKYRPKAVNEVVDQDDAKKRFVGWLREWIRGTPSKKAALLYGPAGCGKTSLVEAAANEYGLEIVEMNASDFRRKSDIERIAKVAATQLSLFGSRRKIILMDEVDGLSGLADAGAVDALVELIRVTKHPVVLTANDPWDQRLRPIRDLSLMIAFNRLPKTAVVSVLRRICAAERLECEDDALSYIASKAEGDLRSAINDLEAVARGYGKVTYELVKMLVRQRDREYNPFETLRNLFMSKYAWQARAAVTHSNLDYDALMEWLNENIPLQLSDPEDVWRAYEALSKADIYASRIIRTGDWDLLTYVFDLMGPGVAVSRRKSKFRWVKYGFPQKILMMARAKEAREVRDKLAEVIAGRLLTSKSTVKSEVLPYLKVIFEHNPRYAARLALGYSLTDSMIRYLSPTNADRILKYMESLRGELRGEELKQPREEASAPTAARKGISRKRKAARDRQTKLF